MSRYTAFCVRLANTGRNFDRKKSETPNDLHSRVRSSLSRLCQSMINEEGGLCTEESFTKSTGVGDFRFIEKNRALFVNQIIKS